MICAHCPAETAQAKDGLCKTCRLRAATRRQQKYPWTPAMDAELTRIYRSVKGKKALSAQLLAFRSRYRLPAYIVVNRAVALDLRSITMRLWTQEELGYLREQAGTVSIYRIAKELHRTPLAIKHQLFRMQLSGAVCDGYSRRELQKLFGVRQEVLANWIRRGWLRVDREDRIPNESIERFVWEHMQDYRFASCEEWWLKQMLSPSWASGRQRMAPAKEAA